VVTENIVIMQWYCVVCVEFIVVIATIYIVQWCCDVLEFIVVSAKVDIVQ